MNRKFLVTTPLKVTWPKDQPILFLGEWCRLYEKNPAPKDFDYEVASYHWDDRKKLHQDYLELQIIYEELLGEVAAKLNILHGVSHSLKYWRILIGPWLNYFIQVLFDRWSMIERVLSDYTIIGVNILDVKPEKKIPNDMEEFISFYLDDDWNEAIYGDLLQHFTNAKITKIPLQNQEIIKKDRFIGFRRKLKHKLIKIPSHFLRYFVRKNDAFFITTYLPFWKDLFLQVMLRQVPQIWRAYPTPKVTVDWSQREWRLNLRGKSGFSAIVRQMIPGNIPIIYLEGFELLRQQCDLLPWPKDPKLIFTSNSFSADDIFKAWCAAKEECGTPLVIGQHGGGYGTMGWDSMELHQQKVADIWLSWGWAYPNNPAIQPVGNLKLFGRRWIMDPKGQALIVELAIPRYSYRMFSVPVAGQWLEYFEEQRRFVSALPRHMQDQLLVRLYGLDRGWSIRERWRNFFPHIQIDESATPIDTLIRRCRLCVSTYNATTFLESMSMDVPTIIFWNEKHWELSEYANEFFEKLKIVGIFHETPEGAAQKMMDIWDDVLAWWDSEPVQSVRKEFIFRYSRMPERPLQDMAKILRKISVDKSDLLGGSFEG